MEILWSILWSKMARDVRFLQLSLAVIALKKNESELRLVQRRTVIVLKKNESELTLVQRRAVIILKKNESELTLVQRRAVSSFKEE
ncbi:hypothetical protein AVEN_258232-1 [Araneus ventricosus]|uniref:Uncharacterized protein n=1 Tax=Araneus ventricosus TaxID=182803 RepID=A0A4Y2WCR3_ARAVE|nr:hypothetical protein AVEN_258232-1 [Araneus ventricosus]